MFTDGIPLFQLIVSTPVAKRIGTMRMNNRDPQRVPATFATGAGSTGDARLTACCAIVFFFLAIERSFAESSS
ncbi:hypothetical protein EBR04_03835 [bacterium]|nr:hypothetical protein [bacterium]